MQAFWQEEGTGEPRGCVEWFLGQVLRSLCPLRTLAQRQGLVVPQDRHPSVHREGRPKLLRVNPASVYPTLLNWETSGKFRKRKTKFAIV